MSESAIMGLYLRKFIAPSETDFQLHFRPISRPLKGLAIILSNQGFVKRFSIASWTMPAFKTDISNQQLHYAAGERDAKNSSL
jgi:hypothetical protein